MIYVLMLWTAVAANGTGNTWGNVTYDWRPMTEFHNTNTTEYNAQEKCEIAARQLGLRSERYRCVRTK